MSFQNFTQSSLIHSTMKILIAIFPLLISSVLSIELLLPSQIPPQLFKSQLNNRPLKSGLFNENCDTANGILLDIAIENCTSIDACVIVPKREYNVQVEFSARTASTNLIWRVITDEEVLSEERLVGDIRPGLSYTVTYSFAFNSNAEGKTVPVTFQIIDRPSQRIEICTTSTMDVNSWHMVPEILGRIRAPTFRNENFIITNYNAVNDGVTDNTEAFKAAIEACNAAGGGRVVVPEGTFLTGAITLLSNVNLHLMQGSTILFTHDTTKYPNVLSRTEGMELINYSPFIYAYDAENIGLTGAGVLDGNADCDNWWPWNGVNSNLQALCNITTAHPGQAVDLALLTDMVARGVPVEERVFGPGHFLRPQFVQPQRSRNVLIEGITLRRSPMWILNPVLCENVIVRGVTIESKGPNSDGCDPESSKDVLIENVNFHTGDDCIAIKSGRNNDGRRVNVKSENIVIQNCQFQDGHGAFTIGSEISGGAKNVFFQDAVMSSPNLEQALRFKNNALRGGLIEDIFVRNVHISELYNGASSTRGMVLSIDFNYQEGAAGDYSPVVRNVDIRNVTATTANYAFYLRGFPTDHISDIRLYDCNFDNVVRDNIIEFVDHLHLDNVTVNGEIFTGPDVGDNGTDCESVGSLRSFTIDNCTDTTACKIITKREYNFGVTFVPSAFSGNLIWRVTATIDGREELLTEQPIAIVLPTIENSFSFPMQFGMKHEGLSFPITYQILDAAQGRVEICGSSQLDVSTWHMVPEILSRISPPIFPNRDFSILAYDAVEGGDVLNTEAFRRAIEACNAAGGGRVVVPAGVFLTSAIQLLSNVNLHLSEGSTVLFTQDVSTYPIVRSRWEGMELMNYSPFIYAFETENIAITGTGTLDGNSDCFNWWPWKGRNNNLEIICGPPIEGDPTQEAARNVLLEMVENNVPVEDRIFGDGHYLRPQFVQPHRSKNVLIEDITLVRSPMWILNPVECENVIVRGVTINSTGPNSDGCDPESCKDVLIENVKFRTGDDCIAVKSGRNADGHRIGIKSENIVVQNCQFEDGHGGFTIGSEISGGAQNIFCQDCVMSSPQLEQALRFKNNAVRGALIEDIFIRNIQISELYTGTSTSRGMALSIDFNYEEGPDGNRKPIVRNIDIRNVTSNKSKYALYLRGFPDDHIEDVRLYDCHFHNVQLPNVIEHVDRLAFFNVTVNGTELITPVPDCESLGTLRQFTIENCTDTTACNIITKREYNINVNFVPSTASSNLIWRVTGTIDGEDVILTEQPLGSDVVPNIEHSFSFPLQLGTQHEGLSFPITYQLLDAVQGRVEICGSSQLDVSTWHMVPEILSRISSPIFPNRDFSILDYDAVEGGEVLNTEAFRRAIEACNAAGGGRVVVPAGVFLTSAIQLLSNVNLHLSEGSTVLFTRDVSTYPIVRSRWEGMELMNYSPFIYAFETENIAITGTGTLDGNSDCFNWWPWKGRNNNLEIICGPPIEGDPTQEAARNVLLEMVENNVPVEDRIFGDGHYLRPQFVQPHRSKNVLIEDITLVRSPMWILNPVECENVIVRGVTINSTGPNSDGCDPESCKDVLIENVKFRTGDDCIAVKSGRNADGHRIGIKSENIVVQNCQFEDGHGGFTIGSEISGGAQNIFCQDCVMSSPQLEQALRFKNNAVRGALIEDIFIRNIQISELYTGTSTSRGMALSIDFNYEEGPDGNRKPIVRNIDIRNVTSNKSKYALYLRGFPDDHIEDVRLYDCHFHNVQLPNVIEHVDRLAFFNVTVNGTELITPVPDCESLGTLRQFTIENCTDTTACNIITKREYNINVNFVPSTASSNLIWRVTGTIDGEDVILTEQPLGSDVVPNIEHSFSFPLQLGTQHEGLSFPITYQLLDAVQGRVEICGSSQLDVSTWHMVPEILSRISSPIFPNRDFSILDYDAVEGGEVLNTEAFRRAIEACNAAGGGRVVVPAGVFLTSAVQLLSNVNLHLSEGSTVLFTRDVSTYPIVRSRWEGMELMNYSPFIYAFETENIAITGTGTLDGNSDCFNWWPWKGRNNNLEIICGPPIEGDPTQEAARNVLLEMVENNVPVEDRIFGDGHYLRPQFVQPHRSKNVLIEDITLVRSPMWILNPVECENVIVRGVTINSTGPNSDGCDPESCKDVLIENVKFRTGDDCIAVKSGRNADGHRIGIKSENIVVQNCQFEDGHGGFTIGSEISGGAQNIFCQDCVMSSPQLEQALRFKNNAVRGALIEDIFIRNIQISELYTGTSTSRGMALSIDFNYEEGPDGNRKPIVRNIDIRNVTSNKSNYALYLRGFPDDHIEDVRLYDCHFHDVQRPNFIEYVDRLAFFNVTFNGLELEVPPSPEPTDTTPTDPATTDPATTDPPTTDPPSTDPPVTPTDPTDGPTDEPSSSSLLVSKTYVLILSIMAVVVVVKIKQ